MQSGEYGCAPLIPLSQGCVALQELYPQSVTPYIPMLLYGLASHSTANAAAADTLTAVVLALLKHNGLKVYHSQSATLLLLFVHCY